MAPMSIAKLNAQIQTETTLQVKCMENAGQTKQRDYKGIY